MPITVSAKRVVGSGSIPVSSLKPDATNTGYTGVLTAYTGATTISTPDTLVENKVITAAQISIRAARVTFRNCWFRGNGSTTGATLVNADSTSCVDALFEDCTFLPDVSGLSSQAIHGGGYTARRCEVANCVDAFGVFAPAADPTDTADVLLEYNWVHDMHCWTPNPAQGDNITHNDCTQFHGGGNIVVRGNTFTSNPGPTSHPDVGGMACVQGTPWATSTPYANVLIEDNWFDYGTACINMGAYPQTNDPISSVTIRNNKFGRHGSRTDGASEDTMTYRMLISRYLNAPGLPTSTGLDTAGNVFEDTGLPVTVNR